MTARHTYVKPPTRTVMDLPGPPTAAAEVRLLKGTKLGAGVAPV